MDWVVPTASLFTQIGARNIVFPFTDAQKQLFKVPVVQMFIMFFIFLGSTRKVHLAALLTVLYYLVLFVLLNDKHPLNLIPRYWLKKEGFINQDDMKDMRESYKDAMSALYGKK